MEKKLNFNAAIAKIVAAVVVLGICIFVYYTFFLELIPSTGVINPTYIFYALCAAMVVLVILALRHIRASEPPIADIYICRDTVKVLSRSSPKFIKAWITNRQKIQS